MTKESTFEKLKKCSSTVLLPTMKFSKVLMLIFPGKFTRKSRFTERRLFLFFCPTDGKKIVSFFKITKSGRLKTLKNKNLIFFLNQIFYTHIEPCSVLTSFGLILYSATWRRIRLDHHSENFTPTLQLIWSIILISQYLT